MAPGAGASTYNGAMTALLALLLLCKPVEPTPFTAKGNTRRALQLSVEEYKVQLTDNKGEVWSDATTAFKVLFAADDSWVALKGPYPTGDILIAPTTRDAAMITVSPLQHLTDKEKERVPQTSCGEAWFADWASSKKGLKLTVEQGSAPKIFLYVSPLGLVSR